ncbi:hypothetical protein [Pectinatus frisingensis]|jgi:hypothetical protein|uniref:hypothetical protein n=1 Tax=Pectinatus frisingensis TaxID=865 RepID=UPI0018C4E24F|nr:hypothetical protein [Pectinatus frisingensis]
MKKIIRLVMFLSVFSLVMPYKISTAQEVTGDMASQTKSPTIAAVMPVIGADEEYGQADAYIYQSLKKALHVPLNGILKRITYIDEKRTADETSRLINAKVNVMGQDGMKQLAESLGADLIIGVKVNSMMQQITYGVYDDVNPYLFSRVGLQLVVYDARTNTYSIYKNNQYYSDEYSPSGTVEVLTQDAMYYLLKDANVKQYI